MYLPSVFASVASGEHIPGKKIVYFSNLRNSQMGERGRRGRRGRKERGRKVEREGEEEGGGGSTSFRYYETGTKHAWLPIGFENTQSRQLLGHMKTIDLVSTPCYFPWHQTC